MSLEELKTFVDQALDMARKDAKVYYVFENEDGGEEKVEIGTFIVRMYLSAGGGSEVLLSE